MMIALKEIMDLYIVRRKDLHNHSPYSDYTLSRFSSEFRFILCLFCPLFFVPSKIDGHFPEAQDRILVYGPADERKGMFGAVVFLTGWILTTSVSLPVEGNKTACAIKVGISKLQN